MENNNQAIIEVSVLWFVNEKQEMLLALRAFGKASDPGVWGPTVTGKVESKESHLRTLIREVNEELGLGLKSFKPIFLFSTDFKHPDGKIRRFYIYFALVNSGIIHVLKIDRKEVEKVEWFSLTKIGELLSSCCSKLVPSAKAVWPRTFKELESVLAKVYNTATEKKLYK